MDGSSRSPAEVRRYEGRDRGDLERLLRSLGWAERFVRGQLAAVADLAGRPTGNVLVAAVPDDPPGRRLVGFAAAQFHEWNALGQLHALAVHAGDRRRGTAKALVTAAEGWVAASGGRGVYVDTPVDNTAARSFYEAQGYTLDYVMTRYYADDLDGVTYVKFFRR